MRLLDTILAPATPPGRSAIALVRLTGSQALEIARRILTLERPLQPRRAVVAAFGDVDRVVVTWYQAPRSYTGEDVVEIATHGAPVIVHHLLDQAVAAGARLAEPGEFTLRAYLNGRIDLPRAEAVRDLIEATTLYQARIATQQTEGSVSRRLKPIKEQLLEMIALLEAGIDFAEDDVSVASNQELLARLDPLTRQIESLAQSFTYGKLVHNGLTLAIVGRPNVGKSSLFNRLLEQDRAIVTDIPGTTRDLVTETASIDGIPVKLTDTAGIRSDHQDRVESLGIERSRQAMIDADLVLTVIDLSQPLTEEDQALLAPDRLVIGNKADLPRLTDITPDIAVSAVTGEGIAELRARIGAAMAPDVPRESGFITSLRHENLLKESLEALAAARIAINESIPHEMLLLDLYAALRPIDAITGATTADDILNRIFSTFCIGK